jgi:CBS domain
MLVRGTQMPNTEAKAAFSIPVAYLSGSTLSPVTHATADRARRAADAEERIAHTDRAVRVVTDFTWEAPLVVAEERSIDEALREMILAGVHSLLVTQGDIITGLITSYEIQGKRPSPFPQAARPHGKTAVGQIMTRWESVPTLDWQHICATHVAEIVNFFKNTCASHGVIVEYADQGGVFVRGIISRTRLERQLGYSIDH